MKLRDHPLLCLVAVFRVGHKCFEDFAAEGRIQLLQRKESYALTLIAEFPMSYREKGYLTVKVGEKKNGAYKRTVSVAASTFLLPKKPPRVPTAVTFFSGHIMSLKIWDTPNSGSRNGAIFITIPRRFATLCENREIDS
jgi:hypothetical protein